MSNRFCVNCGNKMTSGEVFCINCGAKSSIPAMPAVRGMGGMGGNVFASNTAGEMVFRQSAPGAMLPEFAGPLRFFIHTAGGMFRKIKGLLKNKTRLIPVIILAVVWVLLLTLPMFGINYGFFKYLNFLTFARGGTTGGVLGIVGGAFGKGMFTCFVFSVITPLFSGKNPFRGIGGSFKSLFSGSYKNTRHLGLLIFGMGVSLAAYNFFTGDASLQNSMAGVAGLFLTFRALSAKTGFIRGFITSAGVKLSRGKKADMSFANHFIAGLGLGFAAALPLSAIPLSTLPYLCGAACVALGIILIIIPQKNRKEVRAV